MAHNIQFANGQYNAAFAIDQHGLPWHKIGQMVSGAMTWEQAIQLAGLDWSVDKVQLSIDGRGKVPAWGMIRSSDGAFLGTVGERYQPVQNKYMFDFVDTVLESINGAHYESAGVLGNGERVWCLARVPFDFSVGNDKHETFLLFESSHDGSLASTVRLTNVRVVCQNTLSMALNGNAFVKVKHTKQAERRLDQVKKLWSGVQQNVDSIKSKLELMTERKVTKDGFSSVMKKIFGDDSFESTRKQNLIRDIATIFDSNDNDAHPEQRGSAYTLLNAVTNYVDHSRSARVTASKERYTTDMARAESALSGSGSNLKSKALQVIYEEMEAMPAKNENSVDRILSMVS